MGKDAQAHNDMSVTVLTSAIKSFKSRFDVIFLIIFGLPHTAIGLGKNQSCDAFNQSHEKLKQVATETI